jgi:hypothetical protein
LVASLRRILVLCLALAPCAAFGFSEFQQPTPDELKMTSDPAAPDAPAVYLFREETVKDDLHEHTMYARIKILSEKGEEMFSDIEIPNWGGNYHVTDVTARTVHSDGTVTLFRGELTEKPAADASHQPKKFIHMPDVQVGSIIEYRWVLRYDTYNFLPPEWWIQQSVFVHKAHYHFKPALDSRMVLHQKNHEDRVNFLLCDTRLPQGASVVSGVDGYDLTVEDIKPLANEKWMPPMRSVAWRVTFYYSPWRTAAEFWKAEGEYWSQDVDRFSKPSPGLQAAVQQIVGSENRSDKKLARLYAAVMQLDNTTLSGTHAVPGGIAKPRKAEDVWESKYGTRNEIARLFLALCRVAGLQADAVIVVNRSYDKLDPAYLNWRQLSDELVVVSLDGKDVLLDPGERYCEFGKLSWHHLAVEGVRQAAGGTQFVSTRNPAPVDSSVDRFAVLKLAADGRLSGVIRIALTGEAALSWRQAAARSDESEVGRSFEAKLQKAVPSTVQLRMNHFLGLTDSSVTLVAVLDVSGTLGASTGARIMIPTQFFEATETSPYLPEKRENPVVISYPFTAHDQVTLSLPGGAEVESLPAAQTLSFPSHGNYAADCSVKDSVFSCERHFQMQSFLFPAQDYPQLSGFYGQVNTADHLQAVLKADSTGSAVSSAAGK